MGSQELLLSGFAQELSDAYNERRRILREIAKETEEFAAAQERADEGFGDKAGNISFYNEKLAELGLELEEADDGVEALSKALIELAASAEGGRAPIRNLTPPVEDLGTATSDAADEAERLAAELAAVLDQMTKNQRFQKQAGISFGDGPKDGGKGGFLLTAHHNYPQPVICEILKAIRTALDYFHLRVEAFCDPIVFREPPHAGDLRTP